MTYTISLSVVELIVFYYRTRGFFRESIISEEKVNEVTETILDASMLQYIQRHRH